MGFLVTGAAGFIGLQAGEVAGADISSATCGRSDMVQFEYAGSMLKEEPSGVYWEAVLSATSPVSTIWWKRPCALRRSFEIRAHPWRVAPFVRCSAPGC